MAILQRVFTAPNQRFDTQDARALEAFVQNDFRFLFKGLFSSKSYILSGFEVVNYSQIFLVPGFKLKMNNIALLHPEATTQAAGFYVFAGDEAEENVTLSPNATNFIEIDLTNESGTPDLRVLWDPAANAGKGAEFTETIDTVINLKVQVYVNSSGFTPGRISIYKATTNSSGIVTSLTDARPMFFRLGTGGNTPNPNYNFAWPSTPDSPHARNEGPSTATSATVNNQPFQGGDKNLTSFKDWMDAVMTNIKEIKGSPYWYSEIGFGGSVTGSYQNAALTVLMGGTWEHLASSTGHLKLTGGITVKRLGFASDSSIVSFANLDLTTNKVLYILLDTTTSLTYGMGQNGTTPIVPKKVSAMTTSSLTVPVGGNYKTGGGKIMVHGIIYSYTSYTPGTGLFSGVSPDPSAQVSINDAVYQASDAGLGYLHTSVSSDVPGISGGLSYGAEKVYWLAIYDGSSKFQLRNGDLEVGEKIQVSDNSTQNIIDYIGSSGEADDYPIYGASTIPDGTNLTQAIATLYALVEAPGYDEHMDVISGIPSNDNQIQGPVSIGTLITLPLDSRSGNVQKYYKSGKGILQVFLNGQYLRNGTDWLDVGALGSSQSQIQINEALVVGDVLSFRHVGVAGTSGGGNDLQSAYVAGRQITTTLGNPVEISGPAGDKLLKVNGNVDITGVIDPMGMTFDLQGADPLSAGSYGLWMNSIGHLIQKRGIYADVNLTAIAAASGAATASALQNNTGSTLYKASPVRVDSNGDMALIDVSTEAQAMAVAGLLSNNVLNGQYQTIVTNGRLENISTSAAFNEVLYVDKTGSLTNLKPSIGINGFLSGDWVIRVGVICKNQTNPLIKDLLVSIHIVGQL